MKSKVLVLVVFSLLICSVDISAKERRGTELVVTKTDGPQIKGELIAVKQNSLLILSPEGADVSVEIGEIAVIKIIKKSKALKGGVYGFTVGAIVGILTGLFFRGAADGFSTGEWFNLVAGFGAIGAIPGVLIGANKGTDKTIQIEGKSDAEIKEVLEKLRRQARVTNAQ